MSGGLPIFKKSCIPAHLQFFFCIFCIFWLHSFASHAIYLFGAVRFVGVDPRAIALRLFFSMQARI
jgi:hypothetical protein